MSEKLTREIKGYHIWHCLLQTVLLKLAKGNIAHQLGSQNLVVEKIKLR